MSQPGSWNAQNFNQGQSPSVQFYDQNKYQNAEVNPVSQGYPLENATNVGSFDSQHTQIKGAVNPIYGQQQQQPQQQQQQVAYSQPSAVNSWNHDWQTSSNVNPDYHLSNQHPEHIQTGHQQNQQQHDQWQSWDPTRQQYWQDQTVGERGDSGYNLSLGHGGIPSQNIGQNIPPGTISETGVAPGQHWQQGVTPEKKWEPGVAPGQHWQQGVTPEKKWEPGVTPGQNWQSGVTPEKKWEAGVTPGQNWQSGVTAGLTNSVYTYPTPQQWQNNYTNQAGDPQANISSVHQTQVNAIEQTPQQNVYGQYKNNYPQVNSVNYLQQPVDALEQVDQHSLNSLDGGQASHPSSVSSLHEQNTPDVPTLPSNPSSPQSSTSVSNVLEDSTTSNECVQQSESSYFDQTSSSNQLEQSGTSSQLEVESTSSEGGTVAGFFCRDDYSEDVHVPQHVGHNSLGVNSEIDKNLSEISDASLQTVNYSSHGSLDDIHKDVELMSNRFENVSFVNNMTSSSEVLSQNALCHNTNRSALTSSDKDNLHPAGSNSQSGVTPEDDQQVSALNDWELIPRENSENGLNFFIGSENVPENILPVSGASGTNVAGIPLTTIGVPFSAPSSAISTPISGAWSTRGGAPSIQNTFNLPPMAVSKNLPTSHVASSTGSQPTQNILSSDLMNPSNQCLSSVPESQSGVMSKISPVIFDPDPSKMSSPSNPQHGGSFISLSETSLSSQGLCESISSQSQSTQASSPTIPFQTSASKDPQSYLTSADRKHVDHSVENSVNKFVNVPKSTTAVPPVSSNVASPAISSASFQYGAGTTVTTTQNDHKSASSHITPHKQHASAFHPVTSRSNATCMSPTTSLWDNVEPPSTGIMLAPAAPVAVSSSSSSVVASPALPVIPMSLALEAKMKEQQSKGIANAETGRDSNKRHDSNIRPDLRDELSEKYKAHIRSNSRDNLIKEDDNKSINSLDEIDARVDYGDGTNDSRIRDRYSYRDPRYDEAYDRRYGQVGGYRDYQRQYYKSHRDYYQDPYYAERYERPRSRHDQNQPSSRPSSRADDSSQPRPQADYEREQQYRQWDRYRAGYYNYNRQGQPVLPDDQYYRYYDQQDARYTSAYYDELAYSRYGQAYDPRYSEYYSQYGAPATDEYDRSSVHTQSRGNTPALDETGRQSADYYSHQSRSSSRHGYVEAERQQQAYGSYSYDNYAYGYNDPYYNQGGYDYYQQQQQQPEKPAGRLTPPKYTIPHVKAVFGPNGHLVKVLPNRPTDGQPALVQIQELGNMLSDTTAADDLKTFPGPLTQVDTHKNDVLLYCQQKTKQFAENINMVDRESAQLIWKLLERLIKQNGTVIGTDIADLLLEDHEPSTHEYSMIGMKISRSLDELDTPDDDEDTTEPKTRVESDRTLVTRSTVLAEATDRFRNLVLYGRKKDALECAMKNHLWGHALFLASKMDNRTHANVMTRFANSAMKMNDPLQTLYQLMSGRQPAAVTCVSDERWGDWRPHLAMILSNHSSKPELDRKSISILGDTLASKGCLHASHFCYIMSQTGFGTFSKKTSKLVLIGSSHNTPLEEFITNDAIQCTEVYEYAQSLCNPMFILPHFQIYKFIYATRLAEYGFPQEALHYCEVIATAVQHSPAWFQPVFVKVLYEMANRLKYHDPTRQQEGDDAEDAVWLQHLYRICLAYDDGSIQPISGNATPAYMAGTSASSESGDVNYTGTPDYSAPAFQQDQHGHQVSGYQLGGHQQVNVNQYSNMVQAEAQPGQNTHTQEIQSTVYNAQWQNQYGNAYGYPVTNQEPVQTENTGITEYPAATGYQNPTETNQSQFENQSDGVQSQRSSFDQYSQDSMSQTPRGSIDQYGGVNRLQSQRGSIVSNHSVDVQNDQMFEAPQVSAPEPDSSAFDYFSAATGQVIAPPSRFRTTSESSSVTASSAGRHRTMSGSSTGSVKAAPSKSNVSVPKAVKEEKSSSKGSGKNSKGWFSGIFTWSKNKNNEMILPDDTKPSIVWDEKRKRWMNTDETVEDKPTPEVKPPTDTDLLGNMHGTSGSDASPIAASASPSGNRFSRPKGRGARNQYVDVLNPKSTSSSTNVPSSLFNVMPSSDTPPPAQIFNPLNASATSSQSTVPSDVQSNPPNHLELPANEEHVSRCSSMSSLSREVEQLTMQTSDNSAHPPSTSGPVLFNPTQFQGRQDHPNKPAAGSGMKYGQRRQYPK